MRPGREERPVTRITDARVLSFGGCPGARPARSALEEALAHESPGTAVETVEVGPEEAAGSRHPGSPTILVDGRDLFPEARPSRGVHRRVYATPEGIKSHPTIGMVRAALRELLGGTPSS